MPEIRYVKSAQFSPTRCFLCSTHAGPFVDTGAETIEGHIYICAANPERSGCVRQMGRLDGMIDNEIVSELQRQVEEARLGAEEMRRELDETRVVSMDEVVEYLARNPAPQLAVSSPAGKEE